MIDTYRMRRPSLVGLTTRGRGELVPEAHLWRLTEGMVINGRLVPAKVTEVEFAAAVRRHCPDDGDAIYRKLGLAPVTVPEVRRSGRPKGTNRTVVTTPPTLLDAG